MVQRILDAQCHAGRAGGLSRRAYSQYEAAQMQTPWGRAHRHRFALVGEGAAVASAIRYSVGGVLDGETVRVCAIADVLADRVPDGERLGLELVEQLVEGAARDGHDLVLLISDNATARDHPHFERIPMSSVTLGIEQSRRGAPMTPIRGGEPRDLPAIVAMGRVRARPFRFHLDRDVELIEYAIARNRLLAGLGPKGARELHFFIAEEGITAAAYVVITVAGDTWTLEECGDRDPAGARVGALLQALIARSPAERRPTIRTWLPPGFLPPQVTILSTQPAAGRIGVRAFGTEQLGLSVRDVLHWPGDCA
jgi:hypothetical protein